MSNSTARRRPAAICGAGWRPRHSEMGMMRGHIRKFALGLTLSGLCVLPAWAQQNAQPGPFTAEQVSAGRSAYIANCMACHTPTMEGAGDALPLAGRAFMLAWSN